MIHENIINVRVLVMDQAKSKPEDGMGTITPADMTAEETTINIEQHVILITDKQAATITEKSSRPTFNQKVAGMTMPNPT